MYKDRHAFDPKAEQAHYESESAVPPSLNQLDQLEADMHLWVPGFPFLFRDKRVLDLGAGRAPAGTLIAQRFAPAAIVSLDVVFHRLQAAVVWMRQLHPLSLACGDAFSLPFQDKSFDYVVANSILHHMPNVSRAVVEIARVLRPGGFYIGREPNYNNPFVRLAVFHTPLFGGHTSNEYPLRAQEIINVFTRAGCRCELHYFWRRLPDLRHPILSAAISVRAQRLSS